MSGDPTVLFIPRAKEGSGEAPDGMQQAKAGQVGHFRLLVL